MKKNIPVILLAALLSISCTDSGSDSPVTVNTSGNTYINGFFNLEVEKPVDWYAQSAEETIMLQQEGNKVLSGDDENMQKMIEAAMESSLPLFGFFEYPPGTPGKMNPNVLSVAENIKMYPGIKDPCDYVKAVKQILQQGQLSYEFDGECQSTTIGGKQAGYLDASLKVGTFDIAQRYHALITDGYAVSIIQTYMDEESHAKVDKVMDSIQFSR
ncbi:MAG: hypothetical protein RI563_13105 [Thiohalophilus sp.]|uniref:hypothetical protein n=1 Tax=Thiohalophilus sp. TaxID=3028392 RepID=UPI00286FF71A|nr:hypothetical protein [Thiohalophilus sp.]MDR9437814.1 hypothetical protein [Thiohalophilus sp.]